MSEVTSKRYEEAIKDNPPRLIVRYRVKDGKEDFEWDSIGPIPVMDLVSCIIKVQHKLLTTPRWQVFGLEDRLSSEPGIVFIFNQESRTFEWFIGDLLFEPVVGYLELVKLTILSTTMVKQMAAQNQILGVDGKPIRRVMN